MRPPSEEVIKKYFPAVEVCRGWFGRFLFEDRATGLKGSLSKWYLRITAKDPAVERAANLSMAGLFWEVYSEIDIESEFAQYAIELTRLKLTWKLSDFWSPEIARYRMERYISRARLIWHLEDLGLQSVTRKLFGGYIIRFNSGRRIDIRRKRVDFTKSPEYLPGEDHEQRRRIFEEITNLANGRARGTSSCKPKGPSRETQRMIVSLSKARRSYRGSLTDTDVSYLDAPVEKRERGVTAWRR